MMPTHSFLTRIYRILFVLLLVTTFSPAVRAEADIIDDFAGLLDKVEFAGYKPSWLPISGNDVRQSRQLIVCIDGAQNDVDALTCVDDYKNTPVGQKITQQSQIPSWFWDLMETYIAYRTGDYWGVVAKLGEAAICIIAQVMTGGAVDVCGVIEELVRIGKELLDAAKAVAQFFVSLGEGAWEAAKDVGCAIGLGGCDDDNSPPEVVAYNWVFAPKIGAGLVAIEAVSANDYPLLRAQLEQNANANPAVLSDPNLDEMIRKMMGGITFPKHAVTTASQIYDQAVNAQWKADIAKNVLSALAKQRDAYDSPQQVAALAPAALAAYESKLPIAQRVADQCRADLNQTYGYAHVDRWIQKFPADAKGLGDVRTNAEWCRVNFWNQSKDEFAKHFRAYIEQKLCPAFGQTLMCTTVENYQSCLNLMGTVGHEGECGVNIAAAGKQAAERIVSELKAKGSTHNYQIVADNSYMSSKPVDLITVRRPQQHYCNEIYQTLYGKLPQKIVNCKLQMTTPYMALTGLVAAESARLADKYQLPFGVDAIDPLIVVAPSTQIMDTIQNDPGQTFKFEFFPLKVPHFVDGVNKPSMGFNLPLPAPNELAAVNLKQELIDFKAGGPDQWRQPTMDATTSPVEQLGANQMQAARVSALPGMDAGQLGAGQMGAEPMQTMSGSLPPGSVPGGGSSLGTAGKLTATTPSIAPLPQAAMTQGLADLTAEARVTIAGKSATWGQIVTLDASSAQRAANGLCTFPTSYVVRNLGTAASGPFQSSWLNSAVPTPVNREWPAIPPNGSTAQTDALSLKSGSNQLTLTLDQRRQVSEADESNNQLRLTVTVTGQCGAAVQSIQPIQTIQPAQPIQPIQPAQPAQPAQPKQSTLPIQPTPRPGIGLPVR